MNTPFIFRLALSEMDNEDSVHPTEISNADEDADADGESDS